MFLVLHPPSRSSSSSQKEIKGNVRNFSGFIAFNWHVTYSRKPQGGMSFGRRAGNEKRLRNFLILFPCSPLSPSSSFWVFAPAFWWFRIANKSYEVIMARRPGEAAPARWGERSCHGPGWNEKSVYGCDKLIFSRLDSLHRRKRSCQSTKPKEFFKNSKKSCFHEIISHSASVDFQLLMKANPADEKHSANVQAE